MEDRIRLGISACLMGEKVRYDGASKLDRFLTDTLGQYVDYVPVCPEVECGLGAPREAMRLVGDVRAPRLVTIHTGKDMTERMRQWAGRRLAELEKEALCGFIFKSGSPSSGMERVKVYRDNGIPVTQGVGLFASAFMGHFPLLPVEDEGRLHDPKLRESFIEAVFTMKRWREFLAGDRGRGELVSFHTRHKLLVLSHSPKYYKAMGTLVAQLRTMPFQELLDRYRTLLMEALRLKSTPKKNVNVLQHIMGYFKKRLSSDEKRELIEIIDRYGQGHLPLIVPITLLNHYVRKYDEPYLQGQHYLSPHPLELRLRNHV